MGKRKADIFLLILLLGLIAGFLLSNAMRGYAAADISGSRISGKRENVPLIAIGEDLALPTSPEQATVSISAPQAILTSGPSYPEQDENTIYTGGSQMIYDGKICIARWWTLGELLGQADVWEATPQTPPPTDSQVAPGTSASSPVKVVGYYPNWKSYQPQKLQTDMLTHIAYTLAIPAPNDGLPPLESPKITVHLIEDVHKNRVKVLLAVDGWSYNGAELGPVFMSATLTSEKARQLGNEVLAMCNEHGFDGVDTDWKHPRIDGLSKDQYQELILYLADVFHTQGKPSTSTIISGVGANGNIYYDAVARSDAVLNTVDWIHVMAHDGSDGGRHSSYDFTMNNAAYWCGARKVPAGKVVLGVPLHRRPGWAGYGDILAADPDAENKDHAMVSGMDVWYNSISIIEKKAAYARGNLDGIMIWELIQDMDDSDKNLLSAIGRGTQRSLCPAIYPYGS